MDEEENQLAGAAELADEHEELQPTSPLQFLLQPLDFKSVDIDCGGTFEVELQVAQAGGTAAWKFETLDYDITFGVYFTPTAQDDEEAVEEASDNVEEALQDMMRTFPKHRQQVVPLERQGTSYLCPVMGSFTAPAAGAVTLKFDNSYSWTRGKQLGYVAEVFTAELMLVAQEAAADIAALQER